MKRITVRIEDEQIEAIEATGQTAYSFIQQAVKEKVQSLKEVDKQEGTEDKYLKAIEQLTQDIKSIQIADNSEQIKKQNEVLKLYMGDSASSIKSAMKDIKKSIDEQYSTAIVALLPIVSLFLGCGFGFILCKILMK